jgi:hypothetical protein
MSHDLFKAGSARGGGHRNSNGIAARKSGEHVFLEALGVGLNYL